MNNWKLGIIVYLVLTNTSFASITVSQKYILRNAKATPVFTVDYNTTIAGDYTFETRILSSSGDSVLHIMRADGSGGWTELNSNDDCNSNCTVIGNTNVNTGQNSSFRSKIRLNLLASTRYRIIVRSFSSIPTYSNGAQSNDFLVFDEGQSEGVGELYATDPNNQTTNLTPNLFLFSGTMAYSSVMGIGSGNLIYQTARNPDTPEGTEPELFLMGCDSKRRIISSSTQLGSGFTGVGPNSRLNAEDVCAVIIGVTATVIATSYINAPRGVVNIYINDANISGRDQDGDGLGFELEKELGTCDRKFDSQGNRIPICGDQHNRYNKTVDKIFSTRDTDGDGIQDNVEIFGLEIGNKQTNQGYEFIELLRMGSSPTTKDLFFEIDYSNDYTENPFREQEIIAFKTFFENADHSITNPHLNALPNQEPIRFHFDIGRVPSAPPSSGLGSPPGIDPSYYLRTLYGDWGGSNSFNQPTNPAEITQVQNGPGLPGILQNAMASVRNGIFRHIAVYTDSSVSCNGGSSAPSDHFFIRISNINSARTSNCTNILVHEAGHSMGLLHGGSLFWGGNLNGRALYRSIMNYPFSHTTGFFSNDPPTEQVINQGSSVVYNNINPGAVNFNSPVFENLNLSYLGNIIFALPFHQLQNGIQYGINWSRTNNSSLINPNLNSSIRWPVHLVSGYQVGDSTGFGFHDEQRLIAHSNDEVGSPKMIKFHPNIPNVLPRIYSFFVRQGQIQYLHGRYTPTPDSARSSCLGAGPNQGPNYGKPYRRTNNTNSTTTHSGRCTDWISSSSSVNPSNFPVNQPLITNAREVSAAEIINVDGTTHNMIMLAYVTSNGILNVVYSNGINNQTGDITWGSNETISLDAKGIPEIVQMDTTINIFYIDSSDNYKRIPLTHNSNVGSWSWGNSINILNSSGQQIKGSISPSIVWWPDRLHSNALLCSIFTELDTNRSDEKMNFYCRNSSNDSWDNLSSLAFGEYLPPRTIEKPTIIYRKQRRTDGSSIEPLSTSPGHFWLYYITDTRRPNFFVSQELDMNNHPISSFSMSSPMFNIEREYFLGDQANTRRLRVDTTLSILNDDDLATIKGMAFIESRKAGVNNYPLTIMPFVDGTFNIELKLDSDFKIMNDNICRGLNGSGGICSNPTNSLWGY